jgi:hypothetical protein
MADILRTVTQQEQQVKEPVVSVSQLEQKKAGVLIETAQTKPAEISVTNLESKKVEAEKEAYDKKVVLAKQLELDKINASNLKAKIDFESANTKLNSGEWISNEDFNKLPAEERENLITMGITKFNTYYSKKLIAQSGYTELHNGEYVITLDYGKLTETEQAKLNELGVEKFNVWYNEEQAVKAGYTKLDSGEWISTVDYNNLTKEDQASLKELGIDKFNIAKKTQLENEYKAAVVAATPKIVPVTKGTGKWSGIPATNFIRLPEGDMPAWMIAVDMTGVYAPSGSFSTSYGQEVLNIRTPLWNPQQYQLVDWEGYSSVGSYPRYSYKYKWTDKVLEKSVDGGILWGDIRPWAGAAKPGEEVWISDTDYVTTYKTAGSARLNKGDVLVQYGLLEPVKWTEETFLSYIGITPKDVVNNLITDRNFRGSNYVANSILGNADGSYIDPVTGAKLTTGGLVNPYGFMNEKGELVRPMGPRPQDCGSNWSNVTAHYLQGTDIGLWTSTGSIASYITDARTQASASQSIAKIAETFQKTRQLPDFPLMKEVRTSVQKSMGVSLDQISKFETALEPKYTVPIKVNIEDNVTLTNKEIAIAKAAIESDLIPKNAIVTGVGKNSDGESVVNYYVPQSAQEAFEQLRQESVGTPNEIKDYQYVVGADYSLRKDENGNDVKGWSFVLGDKRSPDEIFSDMVSKGEIPVGSKMAGLPIQKAGVWTFSYQEPLSSEAIAVQETIAKKFSDFNDTTKQWEPDLLKYAQDIYNKTGKTEQVIANLKLAQYDDATIESAINYIPKTGMASDKEFKVITSDKNALAQYVKEHPDDPRVENPVGAGMRFEFGVDTYARAKIAQETMLEPDVWKRLTTAGRQFNDWILADGIAKIAAVADNLSPKIPEVTGKTAEFLGKGVTGTVNRILESTSVKETGGMPLLGIYNVIAGTIDPKSKTGRKYLEDASDKIYNLDKSISVTELGKNLSGKLLDGLTDIAIKVNPSQVKQIQENKNIDSQILAGSNALVGGLADFLKFMFVDKFVILGSSAIDVARGQTGKATEKLLSTGVGLVTFIPSTVENTVNLIREGKIGEAIGTGGTLLMFAKQGGGKLPSKEIILSDGTKARIELNSVTKQTNASVADTAKFALSHAEETVKGYINKEVLVKPIKLFDSLTGSNYTVKLSKGKVGSVDAKYTVKYDKARGATQDELQSVITKLDSKVNDALSKDGILKKPIEVEGYGVSVKVESSIPSADTEVVRIMQTARELSVAEKNLTQLTDKFSKTELGYSKGTNLVSVDTVKNLGEKLKGEYITKFAEAMKNIQLEEPIAYAEFESRLGKFMDSATRKEVMKVLREEVPSDYAKIASDLQYAQANYLKLLDKLKKEFDNLLGDLTIDEIGKIADITGKPEIIDIIKTYWVEFDKAEKLKSE